MSFYRLLHYQGYLFLFIWEEYLEIVLVEEVLSELRDNNIHNVDYICAIDKYKWSHLYDTKNKELSLLSFTANFFDPYYEYPLFSEEANKIILEHVIKMNKIKCSYLQAVITTKSENVLCLKDLNQGMSLTNNIEEVVSYLKTQIYNFPEKIIYCDSDGNWDGWDDEKQKFIILDAVNQEEALKKILKI